MTLSGPQALKSLDDALRDIRREEDEIAKRLAHSAERVTKFKEGESGAAATAGAGAPRPSWRSSELDRSRFRARPKLKARDMLARRMGQGPRCKAEKDVAEGAATSASRV
jgi:hypothetical protein